MVLLLHDPLLLHQNASIHFFEIQTVVLSPLVSHFKVSFSPTIVIIVPFLGEFSDVVWAPMAGFLMTWMYKGTLGKVGGVITFLEEILPFSDFIPTFTLTWIYNYWIKKE